MTISDSGYQGPDYTEEKKNLKLPKDCEWLVKVLSVADSDESPDVVFASIEIDGEVLGSVRLPNPEYLRWLRERIQG